MTRLSESHKQDIQNLNLLLNQQEREKSRSQERGQGNEPLQTAMEATLEKLKKNIYITLETYRISLIEKRE